MRRDVADLLEVVRRARRDFLTTVHKFFRYSTTKSDGELALEELEGVEARLGPRLVGREEREAARAVRPRDDRELRDGVVARDERGHDAVARLVVRDEALSSGVVHARRLREADRQPVDGVVDLRERDLVLGAARGHDGRLVHEVLERGAGEADGARGDLAEVGLVGQGLVAAVHAQDGDAAVLVRQVDGHAAVEAAGAQERRVEDVASVGSGQHDDARVAREAVHLREDLVEGLLALVVRREAAPAGALAADGVDLIDEDDARRVLLRVAEQVADARRADADEHLDELRTGRGDEGHAGLAGHRAREQRLTGTGRALEEHTSRRLRADLRELFRVLEEVDDLDELELGRLAAGDVVEQTPVSGSISILFWFW